MMTWLDEAKGALVGSWRLFVRDTGGFDDFDLSERGFWHSFAVVVPLAPVYLYAATIQVADELGEVSAEGSRSLDIAAIELLVQWIAWPLAMVVIARFIGVTHSYARYIIVYNWSSILVMAGQVVPIMLFASGADFTQLAGLTYAVVMAVVLYYRWYIAQTALEITTMTAWALVLGDLVLSIAIARLFG